MGRFLRLPYIKRMVSMNAMRKGLMGGSPFWRAVWFAMTARRMWSKVSKKGEAPVTFTEPIPEGEAWTLVHVPEKSRRGSGRGRKMLVGPKRAQPRVTRAVGPIVAEIARSALAAPPAQDEVITVASPGRKEKKKDKKRTAKQSKAESKSLAKQSKADAVSASARSKASAKADAQQRKVAKAEAKAHARQTKKTRRSVSSTASPDRIQEHSSST